MASAYQAMAPALRLATLWITEPDFMGFWRHMLYGKRKTDGKAGKVYLQGTWKEKSAKEGNQVVGSMFRDMAKNIKFYWMPDEPNSDSGVYCENLWDFLKYTRCIDKDFAQPPTRNPALAHSIGIHVKFYWKLLTRTQSWTRAQKQHNDHLHFDLAVTLVHELAHAFYSLLYDYNTLKEPHIYLEDGFAEAGNSWEHWMFGVVALSSPGFLRVSTWDYAWSTPHSAALVPTALVQSWLLKQTWKTKGATKELLWSFDPYCCCLIL
jgi:hypothetical protein